MLSREEMRARPLLDSPRSCRIVFKKSGSARFISHLDLQRTFNRSLIRSGIPAWYTKGFNPHAKLVFSPPLPLGCESECELCDIKIERDVTNKEIFECLRPEFTDEMKILGVYSPDSKLNDIAYVSYEANLTASGLPSGIAEEICAFFRSSPCVVLKHTKGGDKDTDISPLIESFSCEEADGGLRFSFRLGDGKGGLLSPELIMKNACDRFSLIRDELSDIYSLTRADMFGKDMKRFI